MRIFRGQEQNRAKLFNRRATLLGGLKLALIGGLCGRLYHLQVIEYQRYGLLADENRIHVQMLPPPRGLISDRFGRILAYNRNNYRVLLTTEKIDLANLLNMLRQIIPISAQEYDRIMREAHRKRGYVPIEIQNHLTWQQVSQIEVNAIDLPGIQIDAGLTRYFPNAEATAHIVSYVAAASERDLANDRDPLLQLPGFRIGKNGVERNYDQILRGAAGTRHVEINARGRIIQELQHKSSATGKHLILTVDMKLQNYCLKKISRHKSASAVVIDIYTGDLLALASWPSFDPNIFTRTVSDQEWRALINNDLAPLTNKAISGRYAPGSVFKMVVAMAGLKAGIDPLEPVNCIGYVDEGKDRFHCWRAKGHGPVTLKDALVQSCDCYFYILGRRLGIDAIAIMAERLGFGQSTGIDLPNEATGIVPNRAWKRAERNQNWLLGETLITSIGQGFVLSTPLQNAVMMARLVNGGRAVIPHIAQGMIDSENVARRMPTNWDDLALPTEHLRLVREAMDRVVLDWRGTAYGARILEAGMAMGGKTGTAQVRRISSDERLAGVVKNDQLPWKERDHSLFVGYGPLPEPRYVVSVVVEHGGAGSSVAAPIVRDIMKEVLHRDPSRWDGALKTVETVNTL